MVANLLLPEPVAVCIQAALKSGRKLSWKLQESERGTFVQLVWKSDLPLPQGKARANHRPGQMVTEEVAFRAEEERASNGGIPSA